MRIENVLLPLIGQLSKLPFETEYRRYCGMLPFYPVSGARRLIYICVLKEVLSWQPRPVR